MAENTILKAITCKSKYYTLSTLLGSVPEIKRAYLAIHFTHKHSLISIYSSVTFWCFLLTIYELHIVHYEYELVHLTLFLILNIATLKTMIIIIKMQ